MLKKAADPKVGLYAMTDSGKDVMTLDAQLLTDLARSPSDLLDRSTPQNPPVSSSR
ncbi:MAG: hypothetical protein M5R38_00615 [Candidatus Methylomirabilis sp.]|nr:hypothetical protein [Candidatus Methylomirabilis sp.]